MNRPIGQPTTYPQVMMDRRELLPHEYDHMCDVWARGLSEMNLRSLAADYMQTAEQNRTDDMIDAYNEFRRREAAGQLREQKSQEKSLKSRKSRAR